MTFPIDSSQECLRAWEAMPWVLQDNAEPEQSQWLTEHLAECESCRAEFAQQSRLRLALSLPSDIPLDPDAGLRRLLNRIDTPDLQDKPVRLRSGGWLMRGLVAAVLVQAIGIGLLGMKLRSADSAPAYRTLSQVSAPVAAGAIRVVPDAGMSLTDWNALLHTLHLQIVGGPNEVGAYTVAPMDHSSAPDALRRLRASRGIRFAEPVATP